ncbi:glycosyltransferase family 4 protein [Dyella sp. 20L07]|uniref:glycosyltransferase family 4 protein n=1 Tax=Dyella sp. 20L07 TaxID=3384240 RepID=UPI003D2E333F
MSNRSFKIWLPSLRVGSGADVFMMRLAQGLARAGHRPELQWFPRSYEWKPWALREIAAPPDTDLIHAGSWQGFAFKRSNIPLVVTEHQYIRHPQFLPHRGVLQSVYHGMFIRHCVERSYRSADALVAVSEHTAQAMRSDSPQPVRMIHNWVDTEKFTPSHRSSHEHERPFRLLFVGNPSRWKGADVLSTLAALLGDRFELRCLGGLRRAFDTKSMPPSVRLLASVGMDDMPSIYHAADAVLVPTRYEAFGYVAVEAMACGLPVIGFSSTGTAEVCIHNETALLAPMDDLKQLAAYARMLAADPALCERLGAEGRRRAEACFGEARAISSYQALYRELIGRGVDRA